MITNSYKDINYTTDDFARYHRQIIEYLNFIPEVGRSRYFNPIEYLKKFNIVMAYYTIKNAETMFHRNYRDSGVYHILIYMDYCGNTYECVVNPLTNQHFNGDNRGNAMPCDFFEYPFLNGNSNPGGKSYKPANKIRKKIISKKILDFIIKYKLFEILMSRDVYSIIKCGKLCIGARHKDMPCHTDGEGFLKMESTGPTSLSYTPVNCAGCAEPDFIIKIDNLLESIIEFSINDIEIIKTIKNGLNDVWCKKESDITLRENKLKERELIIIKKKNELRERELIIIKKRR